jgi:hypothetical protein
LLGDNHAIRQKDIIGPQTRERRARYLLRESQKGLYYNQNSAMANTETTQWPGGPKVAASGNYASDLAMFGNAVGAIVISADPSFQDTKDDLIKAANGTNKYICYSVQEFSNASGNNKPIHGKATMHGPWLQDAYTLIGILAQNVLVNDKQLGFFSCRRNVTDA